MIFLAPLVQAGRQSERSATAGCRGVATPRARATGGQKRPQAVLQGPRPERQQSIVCAGQRVPCKVKDNPLPPSGEGPRCQCPKGRAGRVKSPPNRRWCRQGQGPLSEVGRGRRTGAPRTDVRAQREGRTRAAHAARAAEACAEMQWHVKRKASVRGPCHARSHTVPPVSCIGDGRRRQADAAPIERAQESGNRARPTPRAQPGVRRATSKNKRAGRKQAKGRFAAIGRRSNKVQDTATTPPRVGDMRAGGGRKRRHREPASNELH